MKKTKKVPKEKRHPPPYSPARTFLFSSFSSFLIFTKRSNIENERVKEKEEKRSWRGMVEVLEDLFLKTWLALKARPPPLGGGKLFVFRLTKDQEQLPFSPERRSAQRWGPRGLSTWPTNFFLRAQGRRARSLSFLPRLVFCSVFNAKTKQRKER